MKKVGRPFIDLTGQRFGRLTVLRKAVSRKGKQIRWLCQCDCGKISIVEGSSLRRKFTKSCGCLISETASKVYKEIAKNNRKHGKEPYRLYVIWRNLRHRCNNEKDKNFKYYGARGITVCDEWNKDFRPFRDWALQHGYAENLTIDRINNNGNYSPENCRWVDYKVQANNRRSNHLITFNGETHSVTEWSNIYKISAAVLYGRLRNSSFEEAISKPYKPCNFRKENYENI